MTGVKCINKRKIFKVIGLILISAVLTACTTRPEQIAAFENQHFNKTIYRGPLFAANLCVAAADVPMDGFFMNESVHAGGLFDVKNKAVLYAHNMFERLYPASTTKIMTAYIALKYGSLDDIVTVSERAVDFDYSAQLCGINAGDQISLYSLLCGLLLYSGNDNAVAIAEHISGSVEAFAELMNQEAHAMGATQSHFVNPHGLHDENQYTTAYDLYLMFNACTRDQRFIDIISMKSYAGTLIDAAGVERSFEWLPTNYYSLGISAPPEGIQVLGGKTGTTDEAGSCVILYNMDLNNNPYISVIMGAPDKDVLYDNMSEMLFVFQ